MKLIRGLHNLKKLDRSVITIGNFDGVHQGHQQILATVAKLAQSLQVPSLLIIFEPTPAEYFMQAKAPARLMRLREKILALRNYPLDYVLCLRFDEKLASLSAEDFVREILVDRLGVQAIVVGDDFHFGAKRLGNFALLQQLGKSLGFMAQEFAEVIIDGDRVSSTRIRSCLQQGDLTQAKLLLGQWYNVSGRVAHGHQRGRTMGFPTANIHLHRKIVPILGVFAVQVLGLDKIYNGVANIGVRPTVDGGNRVLLEVFIFEFNQEIYGRYVEVRFLHKIRDERRFADFAELKSQIAKDVAAAQLYFAQT